MNYQINTNSPEFKALQAKALAFHRKNNDSFDSMSLSIDDASDIAMVGSSLNRIGLEMVGINTRGKSDAELVKASVGINRANAQGITAKQMLHLDDDSLYRVTQLDYFDPKDYMIQYQDLDLVDSFAKMPGLSPGMTTTSYQMTDMTGEWKIAGDANDIPIVNITGEEFTNKVTFEYAGCVYTEQEIDHARFAGLPLEVRKVRALRRAYAEMIQDRLLNGHTGIEGMFTTKVGEFTSASSLTWDTATGKQKIADLRSGRNRIVTQSKGRYAKPGTMDLVLYIGLALQTGLTVSEGTGTYNNQSVWAYINTPEGKADLGIKKIVIVPEFDNNPFGTDQEGFILGIDSLQNGDIVEFAQPLEMQMKPVQFVDLTYKVIAKSYTGGLIWRYPLAWVRIKIPEPV